MTGRLPFRPPRARSADVPADPAAAAAETSESAPLVRIVLAREHVQQVQRLVGEGKEGASALHAAEWRLHQALAELRREPAVEDHDPPDAA